MNFSRAQARTVRDRAWGRVITYSRKVFIPLTNMCRDTCGYCVFVQHPDSPNARYMTPDEVLAVARAGERAGCKEALFSLGERPELRYPKAKAALAKLGYETTIEYLRDMCKRVLDETGLIPHANPGAMSEDEIAMLRPVCGSMGMMLENISARLAGPGGPHEDCPDKHPKARMRTLEAAGRQAVPFTTGILIGIGETWEERLESLQAIREVHERYGHIQEVIVQNFRAKPSIRMSAHPEPPLDDMLDTIAAARLILPDDVGVQAPPNLEPDYRAYIAAGLNDWGGVSPVTLDHINPERAWPQIDALRAATEAEGYELKERLTVYPKYLEQPERYIAPNLRERLVDHIPSSPLPLGEGPAVARRAKAGVRGEG